MPMTPDTPTGALPPSQDVATVVSELPRSGADDAATRLVEIYERAERVYRAAATAGQPTVGASASANR